ncbi:hypothetical protein JCM16138_02870 [Thermococcus atlanticus]
MEKKHREEHIFILSPIFTKLGGKEYLRIRRILDEIGKKLGKERTFLLLLQVPLLSAQEEVGLVFQLLRDVV